jgi:hypothetical protein
VDAGPFSAGYVQQYVRVAAISNIPTAGNGKKRKRKRKKSQLGLNNKEIDQFTESLYDVVRRGIRARWNSQTFIPDVFKKTPQAILQSKHLLKFRDYQINAVNRILLMLGGSPWSASCIW